MSLRTATAALLTSAAACAVPLLVAGPAGATELEIIRDGASTSSSKELEIVTPPPVLATTDDGELEIVGDHD